MADIQEELKACPFCEENPLADCYKEGDEPPFTEAACVNPDCPIYMKSMSFEEWNTRQPSVAEVLGKVEAFIISERKAYEDIDARECSRQTRGGARYVPANELQIEARHKKTILTKVLEALQQAKGEKKDAEVSGDDS